VFELIAANRDARTIEVGEVHVIPGDAVRTTTPAREIFEEGKLLGDTEDTFEQRRRTKMILEHDELAILVLDDHLLDAADYLSIHVASLSAKKMLHLDLPSRH
jgi:hypothetical protein